MMETGKGKTAISGTEAARECVGWGEVNARSYGKS